MMFFYKKNFFYYFRGRSALKKGIFMKSEDYNQEYLKKALVKLMEFWVMDNSEVEKKLNMDEKSVRRLLDPDTKSDLKTINHFLSIFGGSANVACSIPMKLLKRIHCQLMDIKDLIGT